ncbi:helix-turn-helix domain-containing protein [Streptomyces sp. NPDC015144]|uniref:helix-turn-helix domain-containing protein n=1 Tax=Streptomyces sp. NPDC015144 TaxID=3364944 RepID=UPI0036F6227A
MGTQQASAPARPVSAVRGVEHVNTRHTSRFTVIGNHLAQHRELTLLAIGLATHIQSLPDGARITIKHLAERFPEGETRIAKALRELETHGYLSRDTEHLANGQIVTRTRSYNQPRTQKPSPAPASATAPAPALVAKAAPAPAPVAKAAPAPAPVAKAAPAPTPVPVPVPEAALPRPREPHESRTPCTPRAPRTPHEPRPKYTHAAIDLLSDLHHHAPQVTLSQNDITHLAPIAATWFENGSTPSALRQALTADLPHPLKYPAKLLRHRLTVLLPSPPTQVRLVDPLQNCDACDRAFRAPTPGRCRECA